MIQFDIELCFTDAMPTHYQMAKNLISSEFVVEDRLRSGWGVVVRKETSEEINQSNLTSVIDSRIEDLKRIISMEDIGRPTMRIGVFSDTATTTISISSFAILNEHNISLEISCYPVDDEER